MENERTDVPRLFGFVKIIENPNNQILIRIYGWHLVEKISRLEDGQKSRAASAQEGWGVYCLGQALA